MEDEDVIYFSKDSHWVRFDAESGVATVGLTWHGLQPIGDVVSVTLPNEDYEVLPGSKIGSISGLYPSVTGAITELRLSVKSTKDEENGEENENSSPEDAARENDDDDEPKVTVESVTVSVPTPDQEDEIRRNRTDAEKTTTDIISPLSGVVTSANQELLETPRLINDDFYGKGWLFKLKVGNAEEILDCLLNRTGYKQHLGLPENDGSIP